MKRKLLYIDMAFAALTTIFSVIARIYTRGLKIYVLSTNVGAFLVTAWQIAAIAAAILWIPVLVTVIRKLARKKSIKAPCSVAAADVEEGAAEPNVEARKKIAAGQTEPLIKPRGPASDMNSETQHKTVSGKTEPLIKPRGAQSSQKKTELVTSSANDGAPGDRSDTSAGPMGNDQGDATEVLEDATEIMSEAITELVRGPADNSAAAHAGQAAYAGGKRNVPVTAESVTGNSATVFLEMVNGTDATEKAASPMPNSGTRKIYCSRCGTEVTGKRFCPQCGAKAGA